MQAAKKTGYFLNGLLILVFAAATSAYILYWHIAVHPPVDTGPLDGIVNVLVALMTVGGMGWLIGAVLFAEKSWAYHAMRAATMLGCGYVLSGAYWINMWATGRFGAIMIMGYDLTVPVVVLTALAWFLVGASYAIAGAEAKELEVSRG